MCDNANQSNNNDRISDEELEQIIKYYENMYGFSSEKLLEMHGAGEAPDEFEIHAWLGLLDAYVNDTNGSEG